MGTAGYMAPEQVRGQPVDPRTDIFAIGAVLYELLAGARAFRGETSMDVATAILKDDPPDLPAAERHIPPALTRLIDRCLEKNPAARFQSAGDLAFALESLSASSRTTEMPQAVERPRRRAMPWLAAAAARSRSRPTDGSSRSSPRARTACGGSGYARAQRSRRG